MPGIVRRTADVTARIRGWPAIGLRVILFCLVWTSRLGHNLGLHLVAHDF
jgi:hypothetical protein